MTKAMHGACVLDESWQRQRSSAAPEPRIGEFAEAGHSPKQDTAKYGAGEQFVLPPHLFRIEAFPFDWILPFQAIYLKKKKKSTEKVSWESPPSSILWHTPNEISQIDSW